MATGILGRKLGMTQYFAPDGRMHAVTAIQAGPCTVTQVKTLDRDGYEAVQVGFGTAKKLNAPQRGHLGYSGLARTRKRTNQSSTGKPETPLGSFSHLKEFPVDASAPVAVGDVLTAEVFEEGQKLDIVGQSKGKGFAGGMRRHHFHGGPKTHGQSDRHRAPGSIGAGTTPGRVLKGQRMAGHMGDERVTTKNLEILKIDTERSLLLIKGAVPGGVKGLVILRPAGGR